MEGLLARRTRLLNTNFNDVLYHNKAYGGLSVKLTFFAELVGSYN